MKIAAFIVIVCCHHKRIATLYFLHNFLLWEFSILYSLVNKFSNVYLSWEIFWMFIPGIKVCNFLRKHFHHWQLSSENIFSGWSQKTIFLFKLFSLWNIFSHWWSKTFLVDVCLHSGWFHSSMQIEIQK